MAPISLNKSASVSLIQRQLDTHVEAARKSAERLSTGLRINRASDDAAGLAISSALKSDSRVQAQAIRNLGDGMSLLSIAEGALNELEQISTRQLELAQQAANGTYSLAQRRVMHREANALVDEYNRILESTSFNDMQLLDGSIEQLRLQAGSGTEQSLSLSLGAELQRTVGTGEFLGGVSVATAGTQVYGRTSADLNADGHLDLINADASSLVVFLGNGNGTFQSAATYSAGAVNPNFENAVVVTDLDRDGRLDVLRSDAGVPSISVFMGNGDGSLQARKVITAATGVARFSVADMDNDGSLDIVGAFGTAVQVFRGNSDGYFKAPVVTTIAGSKYDIEVGDFNSDGILDAVTGTHQTNVASILWGNGDGSFSINTLALSFSGAYAVDVADFNLDGLDDFAITDYNGPSFHQGLEIYLSNGNGTFANGGYYTTSLAPALLGHGDINGDGYTDLLPGYQSFDVLLGNGDGSFQAKRTRTLSSNNIALLTGDFNEDGVLDFIGKNNDNTLYLGVGEQVTRSSHLNLLSAAAARESMDSIRSNSARIASELGAIGATQSRIEVASRLLISIRENTLAAESRISSADIAEESAAYVAAQISQQVGAAILAQANQSPALALKLLKQGTR